MPTPPQDKSKLRTGFTTGACSAAAARAAALGALDGKPRTEVDTVLPNGSAQVFALQRYERSGDGFVASIIKDAGDDPDCTHGAEMTARVEFCDEPGIHITGGEGIATVTKVGLGLEVGSLGITGPPRRNVEAMVGLALGGRPDIPGLAVQLSVPGGEEMAKQTLNERLGLVGGISILGTTGIVRPYSTAAYRASVVNAIDLAAAMKHPKVILTTGGKTERYAMGFFSGLAEDAFIQAGDFIGTAVKSCARVGLPGVVVGMIGKLSKMADGQRMTHAAGSSVNLDLLARLAEESGAAFDLVASIRQANTARHALELSLAGGLNDFATLVCREAAGHLCGYAQHRGRRSEVKTVLVGFDGAVLGTWPMGSNNPLAT